MGMFNRGYKSVREEKQRQDENREKMGKQLWRFFLSKDGEEAQVRFLTEEPINFREHSIKSTRNGKEIFTNHICTGEGCPFCEERDDNPSFKGAYLIVDRRPYEFTDSKGKKQKGKNQIRLYVQGTRVLSQLDRLSQRYGLTSRDYIITRSGSGTSTSYLIDRTDDVGKLTKEEIKNLLPEKIRDEYDGTTESLYGIVQHQLEMTISDYDSHDAEDDSDEVDEDEDTLIDIEDEEEEDPAPRKPSIKKPALFKSGNKTRR